ncbi:uncharacterized protein LOC142099987 [Mixophyes fleayi]|uniref:uncharacterized protein LOC142099987 n=1 Tax=Mixophyes fleayi TaxID=3061075 RepID=UPI003F4DAD01
MFLITLLMLVGAALCNDGGTKDCAKATSDDKDCLPNTVHNAGGLVIELLKFLCEVLAATPDDLAKNYQAFLEKLNGVVTCLGCSLNNILAGFGTSYEFLQSLEGTKGADELLTVVRKILELLGISKETEDAVCHTLGPVITSECLKKLTKEDLPQLVKDVQALICEIKKTVLDVAAINNILNRIPCILGDVLKALKLLVRYFLYLSSNTSSITSFNLI